MLEILQIINFIIVITAGLFGLLVTFSKPLRQKIFGMKKRKQEELDEVAERRETDRCLLRDRILSCYFKHYKDCEIKQHEFENVGYLYQQYKKLDGNSFVDKIWVEMQDWTVIR